MGKIPNYEKPIKGLTNKLQNQDSIKNSVVGEELTKEEAKKQYPGKSKLRPKNVYLDGNYLITAIKLETGAITIEQGAYRYDCVSSLSEVELNDLFAKVQKAYAASKGFNLDLKISAKYFKGSNTLRNFTIYEIGEARADAQIIDSLLNP